MATGNQLRKWRESKGMTRELLAVIVGKCVNTICNAEQRGSGDIPEKLSTALSDGRVYEAQTFELVADLEGGG